MFNVVFFTLPVFLLHDRLIVADMGHGWRRKRFPEGLVQKNLIYLITGHDTGVSTWPQAYYRIWQPHSIFIKVSICAMVAREAISDDQD